MEVNIFAMDGRHDAYEFGLNQARALIRTPLYRKHAGRRRKSIRKYTTDVKEVRTWVEALIPDLWEEMEGISDGLQWQLEDVIHEYGGYQQSWVKSGCSAFMTPHLYARNYDYHPKTYDGRFVLWQPERGAAHVGFAQRMIGRMDGMNEHGLALGYHFVNRISPEDGFICCTLARFVLESCRNTEEAVEALKRLPHRHSFNYSISDAAGSSAVVEGSGKGAEVLWDHGHVCTNHYRLPDKQKENRHRTEESIQRLQRLSSLYHGDMTPSEAFYRLNHLEYGVAKTDYGNWSGTIHTAVYDTRGLKVTAGIGVDARPAVIDFGSWLRGEKLRLRSLRGKIPVPAGGEHLLKEKQDEERF
ncbi:C45 family autoproteolytic acyltransferase/hydolase [Alkalicoccus chagannorensis]|uniref:C45 family autoproteolytic acyltransferase/hydolase n=1 Tax=Alkalicoccus chagannorensis TaxID=427072 RepID=UPI00041D8D68|nr:C45 family peptidase [Alkalicoccus chagannorensis]